MSYGEIPETVRSHPKIKDLPDEQQQVIWDLANDLCLNYLMQGNSDPFVNLMSKMDIDSHLLEDIYKSDKDKDLFRKYYVVPDLFAYREMIDVLKMYDETRDTPEHKALINLYLYMMNKMATDPWWFSRLGHYNRFMGSRMRDESYIALRFNLAFTPNKFYNVHTMTELEKLNVNKETRRIEEVYGWVDPDEFDTTSEAVSLDEIGSKDVETTDGN